MSETLTPGSLSRRRFVQSSGALLFAAQCPVGLSRKAYAGGTGAMMNSFVRIDPSNVITMLANNSEFGNGAYTCLLYTSPSPRDRQKSRMPSSA